MLFGVCIFFTGSENFYCCQVSSISSIVSPEGNNDVFQFQSILLLLNDKIINRRRISELRVLLQDDLFFFFSKKALPAIVDNCLVGKWI